MFLQIFLPRQHDLLLERNHPLLHARIAIIHRNVPQRYPKNLGELLNALRPEGVVAFPGSLGHSGTDVQDIPVDVDGF